MKNNEKEIPNISNSIKLSKKDLEIIEDLKKRANEKFGINLNKSQVIRSCIKHGGKYLYKED